VSCPAPALAKGGVGGRVLRVVRVLACDKLACAVPHSVRCSPRVLTLRHALLPANGGVSAAHHCAVGRCARLPHQ